MLERDPISLVRVIIEFLNKFITFNQNYEDA